MGCSFYPALSGLGGLDFCFISRGVTLGLVTRGVTLGLVARGVALGLVARGVVLGLVARGVAIGGHGRCPWLVINALSGRTC